MLVGLAGPRAGQPSDAPKATPPPSVQPGGKGSPPSKAPGVPAGPSDANVPEHVRVGSWNIEWLGSPKSRSGEAKDIAQSAEDLADCIIYSKVSVLAVEEVVTRLPGRPLRSREIEAVLESVRNRSGAAWDYVLFPGRNKGDQLTGVLWNASVVTALSHDGKPWKQTESQPWAVPLEADKGPQGSQLWHRPPHAMKFTTGEGKTDFVLVVLHMKADYKSKFEAHREAEAKSLVGAIPLVRSEFGDSDIVLLGDTNCASASEAAITVFQNAGFKDVGAGKSATHWRGGSMDRVLSRADQPEFKDSTFEVVSDAYRSARKLSPEDFKRRFSDHYMVVSTISVMEDDD